MDTVPRWGLLIGVSCLGAAWLPCLLRHTAVSTAMVFVGFGAAVFSLPVGLNAPDPILHPQWTKCVTELVVIVALFGAALKLERPVGWRSWNTTWRLLAVTMPLCIVAVASLGWWVLGLMPASAILLGAVLAPTDPVLAADVQVPPPGETATGDVRFALTSESGLNDGLAYPAVTLAIAFGAANARGQSWFPEWLWHDVLYKVGIGVLVGLVSGFLLGRLVFGVRRMRQLAQGAEGIAAIGIALTTHATASLLHANGFLAVFVAALVFRNSEKHHEYHVKLHDVSAHAERLLTAVILVLFGGALVGGLLNALSWSAALTGLGFVLIIRPLAGMIGLVGMNIPVRQRLAIAFFGVRGVDSLYLLAFALNTMHFAQPTLLWATVAFVILTSVIVHGITAAVVIGRVTSETNSH
jgi:NhaP-type Na+/H+ or K+/H+ antiporter